MSKKDYAKMREGGVPTPDVRFNPFEGVPNPPQEITGDEKVSGATDTPKLGDNPIVLAEEPSPESPPTSKEGRIEPSPSSKARPLISKFTEGENAAPFSASIYPSRRRQLKDMAFEEDRKPWMIVEDALAMYVKAKYREKK
ncbi:hypothetical protein [Streptomyces sp. cg40]|uniref:hypothetical protein n=1 Tax=Streptomyces sp. cg40 TaxID=3419764 RepID=UPI003D06AB7C